MNVKHACKCHDSECVMTFEEYSLQYNKCPPHEEKSDKKCAACWKVGKYNGSDKLWFLYDVLDIEPYLYCTEEIAYNLKRGLNWLINRKIYTLNTQVKYKIF